MGEKSSDRRTPRRKVTVYAREAQDAEAARLGLDWGAWAAQVLAGAVGVEVVARAEAQVCALHEEGAPTTTLVVGLRDSRGAPVFTQHQVYDATRRLGVHHKTPLFWQDNAGKWRALQIGRKAADGTVAPADDCAFWKRGEG